MLDHHLVFVLTDPGTVTVVTGSRAIIINKKTGEILKVVPEMPILEKHAAAAAASAALLHNTEGLRGVEELRVQAARFLSSLSETVTTAVTTPA